MGNGGVVALNDKSDAPAPLERLRREGLPIDGEYERENVALLERAQRRGHENLQVPQAGPPSAKWQKRFDFFSDYGVPSSVVGQERLREMPFRDRFAVLFNIPALLFGPLYFLFIGLWRRGLTLLVFVFALFLALDDVGLGELWQDILAVGFWVFCCVTVNYAYYRKRTTGVESWNPFEMWSAGPV